MDNTLLLNLYTLLFKNANIHIYFNIAMFFFKKANL